MHSAIARYADTIINHIFQELSNVDGSSVTSTLHLLNTYVRPYLSQDSTADTEMYILFRIVIPYLYDTQGITQYINYLH